MSTKIEWTDETWNPVTGCTKVSQGCKNCYAERLWPKIAAAEAKRESGVPRAFTDVRCHLDRLDAPLRWRNPRRIFVNSMSDLFHEDVPEQFIDKIFRVMLSARHHSYQILTKRPQRMRNYLTRFRPDGEGWITRDGAPAMGKLQSGALFASNQWPASQIWLGVSVEDQATADERIPLLLQTPAAVRFVSYEPALGPVNFDQWLWEPGYKDEEGIREVNPTENLHWIIAGGESGPKARPSDSRWFQSVKEQCQEAGVAFFMKQITERGRQIPFESFPSELQVREYPA